MNKIIRTLIKIGLLVLGILFLMTGLMAIVFSFSTGGFIFTGVGLIILFIGWGLGKSRARIGYIIKKDFQEWQENKRREDAIRRNAYLVRKGELQAENEAGRNPHVVVVREQKDYLGSMARHHVADYFTNDIREMNKKKKNKNLLWD